MQKDLLLRACEVALLFFRLLPLFSFDPAASAQVISTVAGNGSENVPATTTRMNSAYGTAIDGSGNLYIADANNNRIRKVSPLGLITTVAGTGSFGFSGDGGQATSAQLALPAGVAVDGSGNLYIADMYNNRIRKVSTMGVISTVAGTGSFGFSGNGGQATSAQLAFPIDVAVDGGGNLYIADRYNSCIRKVSTTGVIRTIAGTGDSGFSGDGGAATTAQLTSPFGVEVDGNGNVYIADFSNNRVRKVSPSGVISTVAGTGSFGFSGDGGQATTAQLTSPFGLAVDGNGNLYIADQFNQRIRKVSPSGVISTIAGTGDSGFSGDGGAATTAQLNQPSGVTIDGSGNIYIADFGNNRIRKVNSTGVISTVAGMAAGIDSYGSGGFSGDGGQATAAQLSYPNGVAVDGSGNLYITDLYNQRLRKVSPSGVISTVAGTGPAGFGGDGGAATAAQLSNPSGAAVDGSGNIYIADKDNQRIRKVSITGVISTVAGMGTAGFDGDGGQATFAQLNSPFGLVVDGSGNLYIADQSNQRIRKVSPSGVISTIAGTGIAGFSGDGGQATAAQLNAPSGVTIDDSGNLYIADFGNNRIRKVSTTGVITTVAGTNKGGFNGDGDQATSAQLLNPAGVAMDGSGNLYIADMYNNRIRKVASELASVSISPAILPAVCPASTFSLTATALNFTPDSYTWSSQPAGLSAHGSTPNFTSPTVSVATTYTLTVLASNGTINSSASVTLTVNPALAVTLKARSCPRYFVTRVNKTYHQNPAQ